MATEQLKYYTEILRLIPYAKSIVDGALDV